MATAFGKLIGRFFGLQADTGSVRTGEVASGLEVIAGIPNIEYLDDLGYPEYLKEFERVANDPQVAKELRAATLPLLGADWQIEPASDDPRDVEIAELCSANLLCEGGTTFDRAHWMRVPWPDRLRDILRFLKNGHAVFQAILRREGRFTIFDTLKYLQPQSFAQWEFDERDNLVRALRTFTDSAGKAHTLEPIQASDLVVYTWDREGSNLFGKPILRAMWKPWRMKEKMELLEVVDKQKTGVGIPFFQLQENPSPEDQKRAEDLVRSMRGGRVEKAWAVIKEGQDFGWKEGGTSTKGLREIIAGKDLDIAKAGGSLMEELQTGDLGGGAGVAGKKSAFETLLRQAVAQTVITQEQRNIATLVDLNYPGTRVYPTLKVARIDPDEQTRNVPAFVAALTGVPGAIDLDTENEIRRRYGFMERTSQTPGTGPGYGHDPVPPGVDPSAEARLLKLQNDPLLVRAGVDAVRIQSELEAFERQYTGALKAVLTDMRDAVVHQVREAKVPPASPGAVKVPFQQDLRERLLAIMRTIRDFGREQVRSELLRQMRRVASKQTLAANPATRRGSISFSNQQNEVLVQLDVSNLIQRLQAQVVQQYTLMAAQGMAPEDIATALQGYLDSLSDRQIEEMGRQSTAVAFNQGRNVAIQEYLPVLEPNAVRTEVLDANTCEPCAQFHGYEARINSPEFFEHGPPAHCDGQRRCRGFWLVFPKEAA